MKPASIKRNHTLALFLAASFLIVQSSLSRIVSVTSYAALKAACQNALPGDTINIATGVYTITGSTRIMIQNRPGPVLVRSATGNAANVIVEGQGQDNPAVEMVFNLDNSPAWTFADLMTRKSYYHGFKFDHASTDCVLRNVVMRDHGESGVKGTSDPAAGTYPDRLLIDGCNIGFTNTSGGTRSVVEGVDGVGVNDWIIRGCTFVNIQKNGNPAYAIFTKGNSSNTIIERNVFYNCFIGASFGGGGTAPQYFRDNDTQYEHRNGIIRNNVIIRTSDAGIYINKGHNCKIYNNTVFECILTIQLRYAESTGYVRNNLVKRSPANPHEPIIRLRDGATMLANQSNLTAIDAYFMQPIGLDSQLTLHLKAGSAPIDAGVDVAAEVPNDYDGYSRPAGNAFDVGAYEFGAVPVELRSFSVAHAAAGILLSWQTESETNNFGFEIERAVASVPGDHDWKMIGFVHGHGTASITHSYRYIDALAIDPASTVSYRLRQIDLDGSAQYSPTVSLVLADAPSVPTLLLAPQPARDFIRVRLRFTETESVRSLRVYSALGSLVDEIPIESPAEVTVPLQRYSSGVYFMQLKTSKRTITARFLVEKEIAR